MDFDAYLISATLLCFVGAVLANSGGIGGGGIFVPLLLLVLRLTGGEAIPVSKVMILAGAIPATLVNLQHRHPNANRPLLALDIAILLVPATLGGTTLGVMLNVLLPEGVISFLLVFLLTFTARKTLKKGYKAFKKERKVAAENADTAANALENSKQKSKANWKRIRKEVMGDEDDLCDGMPDLSLTFVVRFLKGTKESNRESKKQLGLGIWGAASEIKAQEAEADGDAAEAAEPPASPDLAKILKEESTLDLKKVAGITLLWGLLFAISFLKGGKAESPIGIKKCSGAYWFLSILPIFAGGLGSFYTGNYLYRVHQRRMAAGYKYEEGDLKIEDKNNVWKYVLWSMGAGTGAGSLGIGGGMILGPLLLDLGVDPVISSPITHFMVLFTSSSTVLQFLALGRLDVMYSLYFGGICFAASLTCMFGFKAMLKKAGLGGSAIILALGFVIAVSALLVLFNLIMDGVNDKLGDKISKSGSLCGK